MLTNNILGAIESWQKNEILLLHEEIVVMNSVHHEDPHTGKGHHHASKDDSEDVEDHEGGEGGEVDCLDGVQAKETNANEHQATVDFLTGQRVARIKAECEEGDEEQN